MPNKDKVNALFISMIGKPNAGPSWHGVSWRVKHAKEIDIKVVLEALEDALCDSDSPLIEEGLVDKNCIILKIGEWNPKKMVKAKLVVECSMDDMGLTWEKLGVFEMGENDSVRDIVSSLGK